MLHGDNLPLGVRQNEIYEQRTSGFEPGDRLLLFSDGVTDARNAAGDRFGVERLEQYVRSNGALNPDALVEGLRKAVFAFSGEERVGDDLTCVAMGVEERPLPLVRAEIETGSDLKNLRRIREFVRDFCRSPRAPQLDPDNTAALELAVNEAASNIMKHAYHGRPGQSIHMDAEAFPGRVAIRLYHFGDPFDPSKAAPPSLDGSRESGFGAYIINQSVDQARYFRDERGRNCVSLVKFTKAPANGNNGKKEGRNNGDPGSKF